MDRYPPHMPETTTEIIQQLEHRRLRALVDVDATVLDTLHSPAFRLVHPSGGVWTKEEYIGGVISGHIDYRRFEPVTGIEVMTDGDLAVLRYRSVIEISVGAHEPGTLDCWHADTYRRGGADEPWQVVWSQATEIQGG
jgi:hypothetical protein